MSFYNNMLLQCSIYVQKATVNRFSLILKLLIDNSLNCNYKNRLLSNKPYGWKVWKKISLRVRAIRFPNVENIVVTLYLYFVWNFFNLIFATLFELQSLIDLLWVLSTYIYIIYMYICIYIRSNFQQSNSL